MRQYDFKIWRKSNMVKEKVNFKSWRKIENWSRLVHETTQAARLTSEESTRLSRSLVAEVIAATAFISGCKDPERIAVTHLTTLVGAVRCPEVFGHRQGESLQDRLLVGNYYPGGNPEAVKACMLILELISLNDHRADFKNDLINKKSNPLAYNLNYDEAREKIRKEIKSLSPECIEIYKKFLEKRSIYMGTWI